MIIIIYWLRIVNPYPDMIAMQHFDGMSHTVVMHVVMTGTVLLATKLVTNTFNRQLGFIHSE